MTLTDMACYLKQPDRWCLQQMDRCSLAPYPFALGYTPIAVPASCESLNILITVREDSHYGGSCEAHWVFRALWTLTQTIQEAELELLEGGPSITV